MVIKLYKIILNYGYRLFLLCHSKVFSELCVLFFLQHFSLSGAQKEIISKVQKIRVTEHEVWTTCSLLLNLCFDRVFLCQNINMAPESAVGEYRVILPLVADQQKVVG